MSSAKTAGPIVSLDASGLFPTLMVQRAGGAGVALNGRRNPVVDAARHLAGVLRGAEPPVIVLVGLGLGYALDAIEQCGLATRVIAFEPLPDSIPHFLARRDWSSWLDTGRLQIVEGPDYRNAGDAWSVVAPTALPPVVVQPGLAQARPDLIPAARGAVARAQYGSPFDSRLTHVRLSMLHEKVLTMLEHAAATARGAVVEIGAYVGGSTIAMTRGIRDSGRPTPMFTIEPGGAHAHPELPSQDIFGDLLGNLQARGLDAYVTLLLGFSSDTAIVDTVRERLEATGVSIGLLCIDADGQVQRDLDLYLPLCGDGCLLVVDDYSGPPENIKADLTQAAVDALVTSGRARPLGVYGWGTWMGIYTPGGAAAAGVS
jgi:predicted O-methyltransferase YrrM